MTSTSVHIKNRGIQDYQHCWEEMKTFTNQRTPETTDEIWIVEHPPVFTQGQNGKPEHILQTSQIPIVPTDRGGQVTYHGPGQWLIYTLVDVKRKKLNVREFVSALENSIIQFLAIYHIQANAKCKAPGVYVNEKKICSIGLRVRKGCSYHGLAFNIDMDLTPFSYINPCGFSELKMTQLKHEVEQLPPTSILINEFIDCLAHSLGYTTLLST
jgi:lipoyl(octanoyl) transferase